MKREDLVLKLCREFVESERARGVPVVTKVLHFSNNDCYVYLKGAYKFQEYSSKVGKDFIVHHQSA